MYLWIVVQSRRILRIAALAVAVIGVRGLVDDALGWREWLAGVTWPAILVAVAVLLASIELLPIARRIRKRRLAKQGSLNLAVEIPQHFVQFRPQIPDRENPPVGWMLYLQDVRITNPGARKVNLDFHLHVRLKKNPTGREELVVDEHGWDNFKQDSPMTTWLRSPLILDPEATTRGAIGFFVNVMTEQALGGNLSSVIARPDGYTPEVVLEIRDYVTDRRLKVSVPGAASAPYRVPQGWLVSRMARSDGPMSPVGMRG